jgi:hypothetical protein
MEFDNIETIKRAIEIDAGIGLLPEPTVGREVEAGSLVAIPLDTDELVRPLGIIHRRGKELSSTAERFIELLQREGKNVESSASSELDGSVELDASHGKNGSNGAASNGVDLHHDSETEQQADAATTATRTHRAATV